MHDLQVNHGSATTDTIRHSTNFSTMEPQRRGSQDTMASLVIVDPLPISENEAVISPNEQSSGPPSSLPPKGSSVLGLSGSGHGSVYYFSRLQKYSTYLFSLFATVHLANTSLIPLVTRSVTESDKYLLLTRPYYHGVPLEPLLITLPIATHILSGVILRIQRRNANVARYGAANMPISERLKQGVKVWPTPSLTSISGFILTPLVLGHAFANRLVPYIYDGGSSGVGLAFVSHGFARHPFVAWTGYAALVAVGVGHFAWGVARFQGLLPINVLVANGPGAEGQKKAKRRWWVINGVAVAIAGLWMAGALGIVGRGGKSDGWVGSGFDRLYENIPVLQL